MYYAELNVPKNHVYLFKPHFLNLPPCASGEGMVYLRPEIQKGPLGNRWVFESRGRS